MRQGQTLIAEAYPKELNPSLKRLERNGNPWGMVDQRADRLNGAKRQKDRHNPEMLTICCGSDVPVPSMIDPSIHQPG